LSARGTAAQVFVEGSAPNTRSPHFMLAAVHVDDPSVVRERLEGLRREFVADRFRSRIPSVRALKERPFRYLEDHDSVRDEVLKILGAIPFKVDFHFSSTEDPRNAGRSSDGLLLHSIAFRAACLGFRRDEVAIFIGPGVPLRQEALDELVASVMGSRLLTNRRKASSVTIQPGEQGDLALVVPDYVIGVVRDAMACGTGALDGDGTRRARERFAVFALRFRKVSDFMRGISYAGTVFAREIQRLGLRN